MALAPKSFFRKMSSDCISTENKYSAGADVVVETVLVLSLVIETKRAVEYPIVSSGTVG